jgi:endonuclease/exonuclease/phosphatase family metal-dependent hydrolase
MKRLILIALTALFTLSASAQELNVGTVNVRVSGPLKPGQERPKKGDYSTFNGWDDRKEALCDAINFVGFDVFGAQEVKKKQLDYMVEKLPDYDYIGEGRDGGDKGEFCPVFYRRDKFKLLDSGTYWISDTPNEVSRAWWDKTYNRVWSWGYFQRKSDKARFYFICTHFSWGKGGVGAMGSSEIVLKWIKENCKGQDVILVGDFNMTQFSKPYKYVIENGLNDSYELAKYRYAPCGTTNGGFRPEFNSSRRIDHIFLSQGIKVSRYGILTLYRHRNKYKEEGLPEPTGEYKETREVKTLSDHHPVQAFITLKNAGKKSKK